MTIKIFDAHVHFFDHHAGQYDWLKDIPVPAHMSKGSTSERQAPLFINHNLELMDLAVEKSFDLAGIAHIEAGFDNANPSNEIKHWANKFSTNSMPTSFISYLDIRLPTSAIDAQLMAHQFPTGNNIKVRGFRCILDDLAFEQLEHALPIVKSVLQQGYLFEWQAPIEDKAKTELLLSLANSAPDMPIVLNHLGTPSNMDTTGNDYQQYLKCLTRVAKCSNIHVKCSGFDALPTSNTVEHLEQILDDVVTIIDHDNLFVASNFPLLQLHPNSRINSYNSYWQTVLEALCKINAPVEQLLFHNASKLYTL